MRLNSFVYTMGTWSRTSSARVSRHESPKRKLGATVMGVYLTQAITTNFTELVWSRISEDTSVHTVC